MIFIILGNVSRLCDGDPAVWHEPDVENCSTVEITKIREEVMAIVEAIQNRTNSNSTFTVEPEVIETITEELATNTDKNDMAIFPNDLVNSFSTVEDIIRLICT